MIEDLGSFRWLWVAIIAAILYVIFDKLQTIYLKRKFKVGEAPFLPGSGPLFSANPIHFLSAKNSGQLLQVIWRYMDKTKNKNESFRCKIAGATIFATSDPENIKAILGTQFNDFDLGMRNAHFQPLLGDGIFTLDGKGWKHSRSMLRPNFLREKVAHVKSLEYHLQNLAQHIRNHKSQPFDIQEYFFRLTVDTATEFLFGESLYGLCDGTINNGQTFGDNFEGRSEFYESFNTSQAYLATRAWAQNFYYLINPKEFKRCNKIVHKFAQHYVNKALQCPADKIAKMSEDGYVFLYELVKETRDKKILQDQLLNIMIAGRDTTAGLLSFCMFELSRNPEIWEKLKENVYEHFGSGDDARVDDISFESLKKCEYLKYVINETLRLYPNVPVNYRYATRHTTLPRGAGDHGEKPVLIKKGTVLGYVISKTHRDPRYYGKDAEVFRPERWADKNLKPGWAYLPFNGGPRICLGQQFALTEASYIITRLCQMFPNLHNNNDPKAYPPPMNSQLTLSVEGGVHISLY